MRFGRQRRQRPGVQAADRLAQLIGDARHVFQCRDLVAQALDAVLVHLALYVRLKLHPLEERLRDLTGDRAFVGRVAELRPQVGFERAVELHRPGTVAARDHALHRLIADLVCNVAARTAQAVIGGPQCVQAVECHRQTIERGSGLLSGRRQRRSRIDPLRQRPGQLERLRVQLAPRLGLQVDALDERAELLARVHRSEFDAQRRERPRKVRLRLRGALRLGIELLVVGRSRRRQCIHSASEPDELLARRGRQLGDATHHPRKVQRCFAELVQRLGQRQQVGNRFRRRRCRVQAREDLSESAFEVRRLQRGQKHALRLARELLLQLAVVHAAAGAVVQQHAAIGADHARGDARTGVAQRVAVESDGHRGTGARATESRDQRVRLREDGLAHAARDGVARLRREQALSRGRERSAFLRTAAFAQHGHDCQHRADAQRNRPERAGNGAQTIGDAAREQRRPGRQQAGDRPACPPGRQPGRESAAKRADSASERRQRPNGAKPAACALRRLRCRPGQPERTRNRTDGRRHHRAQNQVGEHALERIAQRLEETLPRLGRAEQRVRQPAIDVVGHLCRLSRRILKQLGERITPINVALRIVALRAQAAQFAQPRNLVLVSLDKRLAFAAQLRIAKRRFLRRDVGVHLRERALFDGLFRQPDLSDTLTLARDLGVEVFQRLGAILRCLRFRRCHFAHHRVARFRRLAAALNSVGLLEQLRDGVLHRLRQARQHAVAHGLVQHLLRFCRFVRRIGVARLHAQQGLDDLLVRLRVLAGGFACEVLHSPATAALVGILRADLANAALDFDLGCAGLAAKFARLCDLAFHLRAIASVLQTLLVELAARKHRCGGRRLGVR